VSEVSETVSSMKKRKQSEPTKWPPQWAELPGDPDEIERGPAPGSRPNPEDLFPAVAAIRRMAATNPPPRRLAGNNP